MAPTRNSSSNEPLAEWLSNLLSASTTDMGRSLKAFRVSAGTGWHGCSPALPLVPRGSFLLRHHPRAWEASLGRGANMRAELTMQFWILSIWVCSCFITTWTSLLVRSGKKLPGAGRGQDRFFQHRCQVHQLLFVGLQSKWCRKHMQGWSPFLFQFHLHLVPSHDTKSH